MLLLRNNALTANNDLIYYNLYFLSILYLLILNNNEAFSSYNNKFHSWSSFWFSFVKLDIGGSLSSRTFIGIERREVFMDV